MEMHTCQVCNKLFASSGPRICAACMKRLDKVYERAREYLRDHADAELNASSLAEGAAQTRRVLDSGAGTAKLAEVLAFARSREEGAA